VYDENQICSTSNSRGYQCPSGFTCTKTDYNPYYNTVGFDNIFYAFLSIFQIITKVGWGEMLYMTSDGTNYFGSFYYILVIIIGNWFILQLIIGVFSNNLVDEIEEEYRVSSQQLIKKSIENFKINNNEISIIVKSNKSIKKNKNNSIFSKINKIINKFVNCKFMIRLRKSKFITSCQKIFNRIMNNNKWDTFMMIVIMVDTISACCINKDSTEKGKKIIDNISKVCVIIFIVEMICKLIMLNPIGYVKQSGYNIIDCIFTILSVIDQFIIASNNGLFVFRILRSLRVLRISKFSKQLQFLFVVVKDSFLKQLCLFIIWIIFVIIFATFGFQLFSGKMNFEDGIPDENFDNIFNSILSIVQLFTTVSWKNIENACVRARGIAFVIIPIIIIIIGSFFLSNILVSIIISSFQNKIMAENENTPNEFKIQVQTLKFLKNTLGGFIDIARDTSFSFSFNNKNRLERRMSQQSNNKTNVKEINYGDELAEQIRRNEKERKLQTINENLKIVEEEIYKGSMELLNEMNEKKKMNDKSKVEKMEELSHQNGLKGLYYKYRLSEFVAFFKKLTESTSYIVIINILIMLSCVILYFDIPKREMTNEGIITVPYDNKTNTIVYILNVLFSIIFVLEFAFEAIAQGLIIDSKAYLRNPLNWIDLSIIIISVIGLYDFANHILVFRVFRLLRIVRLIKLSEDLRIISLAIWKTIPSIVMVMVPFIFYMIIVSIIGLSLFSGDGYTCNDPDPDIKTISNCTGTFYNSDWDREMNRELWGFFAGFDNIFDSLQTAFIIANQEGWPELMYYYMG
ncbi:hypothetical protein BCR36DRAFT_257256, partial [Piromyces finnis]